MDTQLVRDPRSSLPPERPILWLPPVTHPARFAVGRLTTDRLAEILAACAEETAPPIVVTHRCEPPFASLAWPVLRQAGVRVLLSVHPGLVGQRPSRGRWGSSSAHLSWAEVSKMVDEGLEIALSGFSGTSPTDRTPEVASTELLAARQKVLRRTGAAPDVLALAQEWVPQSVVGLAHRLGLRDVVRRGGRGLRTDLRTAVVLRPFESKRSLLRRLRSQGTAQRAAVSAGSIG